MDDMEVILLFLGLAFWSSAVALVVYAIFKCIRTNTASRVLQDERQTLNSLIRYLEKVD